MRIHNTPRFHGPPPVGESLFLFSGFIAAESNSTRTGQPTSLHDLGKWKSHTKPTQGATLRRLTCLSSSETVCCRSLVRSTSCRFSSLRRRSRSWISAASRRRAASLASSRFPTERILAGVFQWRHGAGKHSKERERQTKRAMRTIATKHILHPSNPLQGKQ